jgi:hypothetical protein
MRLLKKLGAGVRKKGVVDQNKYGINEESGA